MGGARPDRPNSHSRPIEAGDSHRRWKRLLVEMGLPDVRFHDLRRSTATLLLSLGIHPKVVQEILGHSSIKITWDLYTHEVSDSQREAMDQLGELLRRGNGRRKPWKSSKESSRPIVHVSALRE